VHRRRPGRGGTVRSGLMEQFTGTAGGPQHAFNEMRIRTPVREGREGLAKDAKGLKKSRCHA
jgi:hypothetical protein